MDIERDAAVVGDDCSQLVLEKEKMRVEFDTQRAKFKELFLHKEDELSALRAETEALRVKLAAVTGELDELKSQLLVAGLLENNVESEKRRAAEEIASLQILVQETVEESSTSHIEIRKQQARIQQLEAQIVDMKQHSPHHHHTGAENSLAPSLVLSAVTKKIGKKLGADFFTSQEEEAAAAAATAAAHKEDYELPLEEEIKALKDKLRATDEELQKYKMPPADGETPAPPPKTCDMCRNYEDELVCEQKRVEALNAKVLAAEKSAERHKEGLLKEIGFRKNMEEKWHEKKEEHKKLVGELTTRLECTEQDLREVQESCDQAYEHMRETLAQLTANRETVHRQLDRLQKENDSLVGKYSLRSQELQNELIDLPNTVDELQEAMLRTHQDLIIAKMGTEAAEEERDNLRGEIILLKEQIYEFQEVERTRVHEIEQIKIQRERMEAERKGYLEKYRSKEAELKSVVDSKRAIELTLSEQRHINTSLQHELDTSETVQKDFVNFSQNLQMQLEKIRAADTQVRWQHEEDFDECPSCHRVFGGARRKEHCRHCGQIFCTACLTHVVHSGPNRRESKVCDVCHTLLDKTAAPYFSTDQQQQQTPGKI